MSLASELKALRAAENLITMEEHQTALEEAFAVINKTNDRYTIECNKLSLMMQFTKEGLELPDEVVAQKVVCEGLLDTVINGLKKILSFVIDLISKIINRITGKSESDKELVKPVTTLTPSQVDEVNKALNKAAATEDSESAGVTTRLQLTWLKYLSISKLVDNLETVLHHTPSTNLDIVHANDTYMLRANKKTDVQQLTNGIQLLNSTKCLRTHLEKLIRECSVRYEYSVVKSFNWDTNVGYTCVVDTVSVNIVKASDDKLRVDSSRNPESTTRTNGEIEYTDLSVKDLDRLNQDMTKPDLETPTRNQLKLISAELKAVLATVENKLKTVDIMDRVEAIKLGDYKELLIQLSREMVSSAFTLETINSIDTEIRTHSRIIVKSIGGIIAI